MEDELASEARIHELEARVEELQALRASDRAEVDALRQSETQAHAELEETRTASELLKQQNSELVQSSKDAKQLKDKTEAEKRELLDALARSDGDKQALEGRLSDAGQRSINILTVFQTALPNSEAQARLPKPRCAN